jgi:ketosteroid isomerase-like protein
MSDDTGSVIERFHEAFNAHDLDALAGLWTEDCVFEDTDPPDGSRYAGRDEVLRRCRDFFAQSPRAHFDIEELVIAGDRAFVRWRYSWGDGHVRGVDVMRVRDGKVAESLGYVKG